MPWNQSESHRPYTLEMAHYLWLLHSTILLHCLQIPDVYMSPPVGDLMTFVNFIKTVAMLIVFTVGLVHYPCHYIDGICVSTVQEWWCCRSSYRRFPAPLHTAGMSSPAAANPAHLCWCVKHCIRLSNLICIQGQYVEVYWGSELYISCTSS